MLGLKAQELENSCVSRQVLEFREDPKSCVAVGEHLKTHTKYKGKLSADREHIIRIIETSCHMSA